MNYKILVTKENRLAIKDIAERNNMNSVRFEFVLFEYYFIEKNCFIYNQTSWNEYQELTFDQFKEIFDKTMKNKELETWLKETKAKNLSLKELAKHISMIYSTSNDIYCQLEGEKSEDKAKILLNQWQKEKEFSPKRGDRVLADYKEKMIEIIDEKINKLETLKSLLIAEL